MITVRFPTGFSVQYNSANFVKRCVNGYSDLYDKEGGTWVAQVPTAACIVEVVPPCRTYIAAQPKETALKQVIRELETGAFNGGWCYSENGSMLTRLKALMAKFDARTKVMK